MGFQSWLTADTKESIPNIYSSKYKENPRTVYLLIPKEGIKVKNKTIKKNIEEPQYEGYGVFGGYNAYYILFLMNKENIDPSVIPYEDFINKENEEEIGFTIGLILEFDEVYRVKSEKETYIMPKDVTTPFIKKENLKGKIIKAPLNYDEIIPQYNKSLNQLIEGKIVEPVPIRNLILKNPEEYKPLKFSFDKNAVYEQLPPSQPDPAQGYFY